MSESQPNRKIDRVPGRQSDRHNDCMTESRAAKEPAHVNKRNVIVQKEEILIQKWEMLVVQRNVLGDPISIFESGKVCKSSSIS